MPLHSGKCPIISNPPTTIGIFDPHPSPLEIGTKKNFEHFFRIRPLYVENMKKDVEIRKKYVALEFRRANASHRLYFSPYMEALGLEEFGALLIL